MQMRRVAACLTVAAALAAGCSGGGKDGTAGEGGATTTTVADQRTAADRRADVATAKAMAITQADFPPGWTAEPGGGKEHNSGRLDKALEESFSRCVHVDATVLFAGDPEFDSAVFTNDAGDQAETDVSLAAS